MTTQPKTERDDNANRISVFMPWGFHGDTHLMRLVDQLAPTVQHFIETGTEAGSTVAYVARMYPHLTCWTCEADPGTHELAQRNTANIPNIQHYCQESQEWLQGLAPTILTEDWQAIDVRSFAHTGPEPGTALFWLDAHSHGWGCPLGQEVNTILSRWSGGYILMDDFQVPDRPDFGYDWYNTFGKVNWERVAEELTPDTLARITQAFYPNYPTTPTNNRGWMLLVFGDAPLLPLEWTENFTEVQVKDVQSLETGPQLLEEQPAGAGQGDGDTPEPDAL